MAATGGMIVHALPEDFVRNFRFQGYLGRGHKTPTFKAWDEIPT